MPDIAKILKEEISRLARKEVRVVVDKTRKALTQQQRETAKLKSQLKALERQVVALEKAMAKSGAKPSDQSAGRPTRFVPKGLVSTRKRLALSVADLANLVGVTAQTVYNWERGATKPSSEQQAKLISLRGVGKREMQAYLAAQKS